MTQDAAENTWATFRIGKELFAMRVEHVQEVLMEQPLTPVPLAPEHIVGLLNLRGQIMPAIDVRKLLRFEGALVGPSSLLVLKTHSGCASIVVDEIGDVLELDAAGWRPPPETLDARHKGFVSSIFPIQDDVVLALGVEALFAASAQAT